MILRPTSFYLVLGRWLQGRLQAASFRQISSASSSKVALARSSSASSALPLQPSESTFQVSVIFVVFALFNSYPARIHGDLSCQKRLLRFVPSPCSLDHQWWPSHHAWPLNLPCHWSTPSFDAAFASLGSALLAGISRRTTQLKAPHESLRYPLTWIEEVRRGEEHYCQGVPSCRRNSCTRAETRLVAEWCGFGAWVSLTVAASFETSDDDTVRFH